MSLEAAKTLECPKCGHSQEVVIWRSLNVDVSPESKKELFEGRINMFECKNCGNQAQIDVPFMYHDMRRQVCIQYHPLSSIQEERFLAQFDPDATLNAEMLPGDSVVDYMRRQHVVFNMAELIRYAMFRERLFDHFAFRPPQAKSGD